MAQDDSAGEELDADVVFQHPFHQRLKVIDVGRNDLQQVVVAAADVVALDDLLVLPDAFFKFAEIMRPVAVEGDFREYDDVIPKLVQRDIGAVAADQPDLLQPLGAQETRAGAEAEAEMTIPPPT